MTTALGAIAACRRRTAGGGESGPTIDPATLAPFAFWDPADLSTLFQDVAGMLPVTAAGQPVGRMLDKSGNGYHLVAGADDATRPTFGEEGAVRFLAFDAAGDQLRNFSFPLDGRFNRITALRSTAVPGDYGQWWGHNGYEHILEQAGTSWQMQTQTPTTASVSGPAVAASTDYVLVERHLGASSRIRADLGTYSTGTLGTAEVSSITLNRGTFGGEQTDGRFYGSMIRPIGTPMSDAEIDGVTRWFGARQGRAL